MAAPPSSSTVIPPIVGLLVRVLTFFFLLTSMIVFATNKTRLWGESVTEIFAYRYLLSCIVIGLAYTMVQVGFSVIHVSTGRRVVESLEEFDFYPDLVLSNLLVTGAAASFGLTVDVNGQDTKKTYASTSLCLIAFVFAAISTIISQHNATRKTTS